MCFNDFTRLDMTVTISDSVAVSRRPKKGLKRPFNLPQRWLSRVDVEVCFVSSMIDQLICLDFDSKVTLGSIDPNSGTLSA